jgi:ribonuclease BN (tRNA processing enzyme)
LERAAMSEVRLQFLGCGDAFSSGGRFQTCFHLDGAEEPLLIDCGATSLTALKRAGIDPAAIGFVAITHLHGDHFGGLPWLILDGQFAGRTKPLVIAGPPGTEERLLRTFEALYPGAAGADRRFETTVVELPERRPAVLGPAVVTPYEVRHGSGAPPYALRVEYGGKVIAYSGDTEWTDSLIEVSDGADLFVCECNFFDTQVPFHLSWSTLSSRRDALTCARLMLTHMSEEMLARAAGVGVEVASDGAVIVV